MVLHRIRRAALACLTAVLALPAIAADAAVPVTTSISDVRGMKGGSGGKTMVTYEVTHEITGHVDPFTALPGARVPRSEAFDGMWAENGFMGAWLAPTGSFRFQFSPQSRLVEDAYFTNSTLQAPSASPMESGDRFEIAMGNMAWNAPLPTDQPRGDASGELEWDETVDVRQISANHAGDTATMDSLFIRADIVARGGDVDARSEAVDLPPLLVDLPRQYPQQPQGMYQINVAYPYTHYVASMSMRVIPTIGKAVIEASVRGYIHEAKEYRLPGGADIQEWHIPLNAFAVLSPSDDLVPQGVVGMPAGGEALVGEIGGVAERFDVAAGGSVMIGDGVAPRVAEGESSAAAAAGPASAEVAEYGAANLVNRTLDHPVDLSAGDGGMEVTLDPDFRGQGVLALVDGRRHTGARFAEAITVPYVVVDGQPVRLDRSRLVGLRVLPFFGFVGVQFTSSGGSGQLHKVRTNQLSAVKPGLDVSAVYDLGQERYAFVRMLGVLDGAAKPLIQTEVRVISLNLTPLQARPVYYQQLPPGDVAHAGKGMTNEFELELDAAAPEGEPAREPLTIGQRSFSASAFAGSLRGRVTVLRGVAPLQPAPEPDPSRSLEGGPVSLVYELPTGAPAGWNRRSIAMLELTDDLATPAPSPKPIGTACGLPQVTDGADRDAPPGLDVAEAWLDADGPNIYATIRLREAPSAPPAGVLRYSFDWRSGHLPQRARAALGSDGIWRFDFGGAQGGFFKLGDVNGEVSGALIRIAVPKSLVGVRDDALLRDTGAHSWIEASTASRVVDSAPEGAAPSYGSGGDYLVGRCA